MKISILLLAVVALVTAAPKPTKLNFRNLYKPSAKNIKAQPNPRIVGGQEAEPHSIPYQVFLTVQNNNQAWYCGGTLISENYVLTAAVCLENGLQAKVTLGAHNFREQEDTQVVVTSTNLTYHEDWDSEWILNDIGVIALPEAVTFTDAIQPIALPTTADTGNLYVGETGRVSGWGATEVSDVPEMSDVLNYLDVTVITNEECEQTYGMLPKSNICTAAGEDWSAVCDGDPGGPLVVDNVQVGIVSFAFKYCLGPFPSGFTRITSFLDWIENHTDVQID